MKTCQSGKGDKRWGLHLSTAVSQWGRTEGLRMMADRAIEGQREEDNLRTSGHSGTEATSSSDKCVRTHKHFFFLFPLLTQCCSVFFVKWLISLCLVQHLSFPTFPRTTCTITQQTCLDISSHCLYVGANCNGDSRGDNDSNSQSSLVGQKLNCCLNLLLKCLISVLYHGPARPLPVRNYLLFLHRGMLHWKSVKGGG